MLNMYPESENHSMQHPLDGSQNQESLSLKFKELYERMKNLDNLIEEQRQTNQRLLAHIDFVESVYERIKSPFHYLMELPQKCSSYSRYLLNVAVTKTEATSNKSN